MWNMFQYSPTMIGIVIIDNRTIKQNPWVDG